jgi:endonuclease YncB( thermonuclease family)
MVAIAFIFILGSLDSGADESPTTAAAVETTRTTERPRQTPITTLPTTTTTVATTTTIAHEVAASVVKITDGDTIRVGLPDGTEEPVRLIGIDSPEQGRPMSSEAASCFLP